MPPVFTILLYIPAGCESFYGVEHYEALIASCCHLPVHFIIGGGGRLRTVPGASVEYVTWAETPHDGLSCMVLEALSHGRYVVWNHHSPFAGYASTFEDASAQRTSLLSRFSTGELQPQGDAAAYVQERYERTHTVEARSVHWSRVFLAPPR